MLELSSFLLKFIPNSFIFANYSISTGWSNSFA